MHLNVDSSRAAVFLGKGTVRGNTWGCVLGQYHLCQKLIPRQRAEAWLYPLIYAILSGVNV